ncbi:MAG TPA: hypothetical protein VEV44_08725, partial [Pseudoneobacillus sp.]|nr:hypothetical protein [Pseudoneobacillus sp.]
MSIIDGHQKKKWKIVEFFITFFGWFVVLGFFTQIVISIILWVFNLSYVYKELIIFGTIEDSIFILLTTLILAISSFTIMYVWGRYNFKRFAHLDRRHL